MRSITITHAVVIHGIVCTAVTTERVVIGSTICFWDGLRAVTDGVVSAAHFKAAVRPGGLLSDAHFLSGSSGCALAYLPTALHGPVGKVRTFSPRPADATARAGLLLSTAQILT